MESVAAQYQTVWRKIKYEVRDVGRTIFFGMDYVMGEVKPQLALLEGCLYEDVFATIKRGIVCIQGRREE